MMILDKIRSFFSDEILHSEIRTTKGSLFWPNNDMTIGPKYLIRLHDPLDSGAIDWSEIEEYFRGGNREVCRRFFSECNGFSIGPHGSYSAFGILTKDAYDGKGLSFLNVPYDIAGQSSRSYPKFGPVCGYYLGHFEQGPDKSRSFDIVAEDGQIVSGAFDKSSDVLERFSDMDQWLEARVPKALNKLRVETS